jgi:transposase
VVSHDAELEALRMLADRRDELSRLRVQTVNRLQRLLSELLPGQRKRDLSALQAKAMLATVRPRDLAGRTRRRMAVEELTDLVVVDAKLKKIKAELNSVIVARGSTLLDINGVGPAGAAASWPTSATSPASPTATGSPRGPAPHRWTPPPASRSAIDSPAPATGA